MKEKIIEILERYEKMAFSRPSECATEIESLYKDYYSKEFILWKDRNVIISDDYKYIIIENGKLIRINTHDELHTYWKNNIRDKQ